MPLQWNEGKNPYVWNYFGKIKLGSNATPPQIIAQARNLAMIARDPSRQLTLGGHALDEHAINEAAIKLQREPAALAEDLLLVHPQPRQDGHRKLKQLAEKLKQTSAMPEDRTPIPLISPQSLFWFLPVPEPDAVPWPEWADFGLVAAGDPADRELDIVFDE